MFNSILPNAITGDRPTGPLHVGHFVGSLRARVQLQHTHNLTVLIADQQALTDNASNPLKVQRNILEVMRDYLAVGLDPNKVRFVLQSAVPQLSEIAMYLQNMITVAQLERNPTVRAEIAARGFARDIPAGFLCYPVSQAADIMGLGSGVVPAGDDQLPMIETTNTLIDRLNAMSSATPLPRCSIALSTTPRLMGIDGKGKMSKSMGNAISLGCSHEELSKAVMSMFTDPNHLKVSDPGSVEGNAVFAYLDAFDNRMSEVQDLKDHYRRGGLGDVVLKKRLLAVMEDQLAPIRARRALPSDNDLIDVLRQGTFSARQTASGVCDEIKSRFGILSLG